jgi:hypothetical protein
MRWRGFSIIVPPRGSGIVIMERIVSGVASCHRYSIVRRRIILRKSVWRWHWWDSAIIVVDTSSL